MSILAVLAARRRPRPTLEHPLGQRGFTAADADQARALAALTAVEALAIKQREEQMRIKAAELKYGERLDRAMYERMRPKAFKDLEAKINGSF